jgi:protein TonB
MALSIGLSVLITGVLFGLLPFSHMVAKPTRTLELRKTSIADLPPPVDDPPPAPPMEAEPPPAAPPQPQLAETPQQIPLSADLEVATGSGGALAGFGEVQAMATVDAIREEAFEVEDLERGPEVLSQVPPVYPAELRKARVEGTVTLALLVGKDGTVEEARVENSSRSEFEQPALEAVRRWRFRPGTKEGNAAKAFVRIPLRFRIPRS